MATIVDKKRVLLRKLLRESTQYKLLQYLVGQTIWPHIILPMKSFRLTASISAGILQIGLQITTK